MSITNNNMTGLSVYRTTVVVNSNSSSVFYNNTGIDGGGLAMYEDSYLMFEQDSLLNFTINRAKNRGGAIFVDSSTQYMKFACFFQYSGGTNPQSTKATFSGNMANIAGSVLFGGEIDFCFLYSSTHSNSSDSFHKTF